VHVFHVPCGVTLVYIMLCSLCLCACFPPAPAPVAPHLCFRASLLSCLLIA
jgi:hypothetical protein